MKANKPLITNLQVIIHWAVRALAILMVVVIVMGVVDVGWTLYQRLLSTPTYILTISDMLATFGAFMAVLIAIEIFINIVIYLQDDVIHVKIVMATALMAIARKVIILDLKEIEPAYLWGIASVVLALSIGYWLVASLPSPCPPKQHNNARRQLPKREDQAEPVLSNTAEMATAKPLLTQDSQNSRVMQILRLLIIALTLVVAVLAILVFFEVTS